MKLAISIVYYRSEISELESTIRAVNGSSFNNYKIFLLNNSPEINLDSLISKYNIDYYKNNNVGFGKAHNMAIKESIEKNTKYHLILNPDVTFEPDIIEKIIDFMDQNESVGLVMPQVKYPNGQIQHLCKLIPTPVDLIGRRFIPFRKYIERRNFKYELLFTGYKNIMEVPYLSGCFMFIRTSILKEIGGFDERFFMYCEDVDLSRRIGQIAKTVFYPEVEVIHNYEKGSYKNLKLLKYHILSAIKYFNKWGWIFDNERKKINKRTLFNLGYFNMNKN